MQVYVTRVDPWHDYLAVPIAPLVLGAHAWALASNKGRAAVPVSAAAVLAVAAMLVFVMFGTDVREDDANIGAGLLLFELAASGVLLAATVRRFARG